MTSYESNIIQSFKEDKEAYTKFFKDAMKKFGIDSPEDLADDEKKKEFYKYVDSNYKAKNEAAPEGWEGTVKAMKDNGEIDNPYALAHWMKNKGYKSHKKEFKEYMELKRHQYSEASNVRVKSDAYIKAMNYLDKYFLNLAATPAPKKAKKVSKIMTALQKIFFSKDESVNEALLNEIPASVFSAAAAATMQNPKTGKKVKVSTAAKNKDHPLYKKAISWIKSRTKSKKKDAPKKQSQSDADFWKKQLHVAGVNEADGMTELVVRRAIDRAMQAAGIKIKKIDKMKSDKISEPFGWFYKVEAGNKRVEDIMPFYVDKRGNVNLGVSSKDWIIGNIIGGHSKMVKNLKDYKKTDLDEGSLAKVKEVASPLDGTLRHAITDVDKLIDVIRSEHANDAYSSPKKSGKLLAAARKLLKKVK